VNNFSTVLSKCDNDIYHTFPVAVAYAHIHLLERYRRFWKILLEMLNHNCLPMRSNGVEVLDIGTGPAPVLYAIADFYDHLDSFITQRKLDHLKTGPPRLYAIEKSIDMARLINVLSEISGRKGPFGPIVDDFTGLNLDEQRDKWDYEYIEKVADELGVSDGYAEMWINTTEGKLHTKNRYSMIIFSYFLTQTDLLSKFESEIASVVKSLRCGGSVIVVGGMNPRYQKIYNEIERNVCKYRLLRQSLPDKIPCDYDDDSAKLIKNHYNTIWSEVKKFDSNLDEIKKNINEDLWNPKIPLKGPKHFGVRVFRKYPYTK